MSDEPLTIKGSEKKIFLAALRAYSDNCALPKLTPGCPYFEITAQGPSCGEQCKDILAKRGPALGTAWEPVLNLGGGYEVFRRPLPRPRRPPDPSVRPFDATVIRRTDNDRPHDRRRTTSLVDELREYLIMPPWMHPDPDERAYNIGACREELAARGLDVEALIRYAIAPKIAYMIGLQLAISEQVEQVELDPMWIRFLEQSYDAEQSADRHALMKHAFTGAFSTHVIWWAATVPLEEIENWHPPAGVRRHRLSLQRTSS